MSAHFLLKPSGDQFMFNLKGGNGETVLTSERYTSKQSAKNGIDSVKANSTNDARYEKKTSTSGQAYFVLKAANGEPIGSSEMYSSPSARDAGIAWVKANAAGAAIKE